MEETSPGGGRWMPAALTWDRAGLHRMLAFAEVKGSVWLIRAFCIIRWLLVFLSYTLLFICLCVFASLSLSEWLVLCSCLVSVPLLPCCGCLRLCLFIFVCVSIYVSLSLAPFLVLSLSMSPSPSVPFPFQQLLIRLHWIPPSLLEVGIHGEGRSTI